MRLAAGSVFVVGPRNSVATERAKLAEAAGVLGWQPCAGPEPQRQLPTAEPAAVTRSVTARVSSSRRGRWHALDSEGPFGNRSAGHAPGSGSAGRRPGSSRSAAAAHDGTPRTAPARRLRQLPVLPAAPLFPGPTRRHSAAPARRTQPQHAARGTRRSSYRQIPGISREHAQHVPSPLILSSRIRYPRLRTSVASHSGQRVSSHAPTLPGALPA